MKKHYAYNHNPNFWDTERTDSNCGSFALNTAEWVEPFYGRKGSQDRHELIRDLMDEGTEREVIMSALTRQDVEYLLQKCPWIEGIDSLDDVSSNERVIAYRVGIDRNKFASNEIDEDYHFRVRIDGIWWEKCGCYSIECCDKQDIFDYWYNEYCDLTYDGEIHFFRFKKDYNFDLE